MIALSYVAHLHSYTLTGRKKDYRRHPINTPRPVSAEWEKAG